MKFILIAVSCALVLGSGAMTLADYSNPPAETPLGGRLGRYYLLDDDRAIWAMTGRLDRIGAPAATPALLAALQRNSGSAFRWDDAGEVFLAADDRQRAEYCYRRAVSLAPRDAGILYAAADYYTYVQDPAHAVPLLAGILRLTGDRTFDSNVYTYLERVGTRQSGLLEEAIPDAAAAADYLRYLIAENNTVGVRELWNLTRKHGYDDDPLTVDYTTFLLRQKQFDAAAEAWAQHFSARNDGYPESTLLFNGGFEYALTGSDLDWRFDGFSGVKVDRDSESRYAGKTSLRIGFTGNDNPDFHHLRQLVFVQPGRYRFEAQMRTDRITSDEGVRFRIQASEGAPPLMVETAPLSGTNPWKRVTAEFEVPPGVRMVSVQLARRRSIRIDYQLTGTVWIDDARLSRLP